LEPLVILLAFVAGLAFKKLGYPPLPGYLIAGFVAHELGLGEVALIS
jgi:glutathione-regulated potassium-efflux system ancillary protein KefC